MRELTAHSGWHFRSGSGVGKFLVVFLVFAAPPLVPCFATLFQHFSVAETCSFAMRDAEKERVPNRGSLIFWAYFCCLTVMRLRERR
jgi:hypothetical protein